jgi:hypothetical protein
MKPIDFSPSVVWRSWRGRIAELVEIDVAVISSELTLSRHAARSMYSNG